MLVAIHQPHYLPWPRYFEKIARADVFIVLDNIQYSRNGWQNRNRVRGARGDLLLTVPVLDRHRQGLDEVRINNTAPWRRKHLAALRQAYGKAPHFDALAPLLEDTYAREWDRLNPLNRHMLEGWVRLLGIDTPLRYASDLDVPGTATERLANLIRAVGGDAYYSGAFALDAYLDPAVLHRAGIRLLLQHWTPPVYDQARAPFLADLSIVDLLAHLGPGALPALRDAGRAVPHDPAETRP